jgi:type II secretory pathway pseudopilin PulG
MSPTRTSERRRRSGESGFTLAALIVILTIMAIVIAYTVPEQWSLIMRRERERQTIFMMKQFARGIREFQRKHNNTLPVSLQQLQEAREPRFLRGSGKWICPITGRENDWVLVPPNAVNMNQQQQQQRNPAGTAFEIKPPSTLNKEASPKDYVGQFVGVRPNATGASLIALNGAQDYGDWVFTIQDLENEIGQRLQALATPQ